MLPEDYRNARRESIRPRATIIGAIHPTPAAPAPMAWPAWRQEVAALARMARRRVQLAHLAARGARPGLDDEIALVAAHLADLQAVARLRAARLPETVITQDAGVEVEVGR